MDAGSKGGRLRSSGRAAYVLISRELRRLVRDPAALIAIIAAPFLLTIITSVSLGAPPKVVHQPRLLVLDEPTVGVDPQSRTAILDRLADLKSTGVAILYTTHYMDEVERFCDTIGVIDHGKLIAEGTRRDLLGLIGGQHRISVQASGNLGALAIAVDAMSGVREVRAVLDGVQVLADDAATALAGIVEAASACGVTITSLEVSEPDLEHVFLHLTGRELRDT